MRSMACALVVLVHVNLYVRPGPENWWPGGDYSVPLFSLAVPIFFLLSGFFSVNLSGSVKPTSLSHYLRRKVRRLVAPFLFWSLVLLALGVEAHDDSWVEVGYTLLTGPWHLYYVFVLFQFYVLSFYLERFVRPAQLDAVLAAAALLSILSYSVSELYLWWLGGSQQYFEIQARKAFPFWIMFFVSGVWLRWRTDAASWLARRASHLSLLAALAYALYLWQLGLEGDEFGYHPRLQFLLGGLPFQAVGSLLAVLGLLRLQFLPRARKALVRMAACAKDSFGIYLSHVVVLMGLFALWTASGISTAHWVEVPVMATLVWLVCQAAIRVVRRLRLRRLGFILFGMRIHEKQPIEG
jgi:peptidoglycan/LPS O-acetylase OafA/YrhL